MSVSSRDPVGPATAHNSTLPFLCRKLEHPNHSCHQLPKDKGDSNSLARDQYPTATAQPESKRAPLVDGSARSSGERRGGVATPRNFLVLSAGESVVKVLTFFVFTYLGRTLGPAGYGNLEFTFALMTFFALSVNLGLSTYGAREIAKQRSRAVILLRDICLLRALLAVGLFAVLVLACPAG